jgi:hypothetical protein
MKKVIASMIVLAGVAGTVNAQTWEPGGGRLSFEVFDPTTSTWTNSVSVLSGATVQVRVRASYIGTRTDLFAMGEALYQPTFSNADNTGTGAQADQVGTYVNGGNGGNSTAGSILTTADGNNGGALAGYGRVNFGATVNAATAFNTLSTFRHTAGSDGAPAGSYIRIAGVFVSQWPRVLNPVPPVDVVADDLNRILRGVSAQQQSRDLQPTFHTQGLNNVIFRQAITLSDDAATRTLQFSSFQEAIRRWGSATGTTEPDDRRYMTWQTSSSNSGSDANGHRTGVEFVPASIIVNIPTPGAAALMGLGGLMAARRRR